MTLSVHQSRRSGKSSGAVLFQALRLPRPWSDRRWRGSNMQARKSWQRIHVVVHRSGGVVLIERGCGTTNRCGAEELMLCYLDHGTMV